MQDNISVRLQESVNMNERIRQFERESKLEIFGLGARRDYWDAAVEKFAESIVRECATWVNDNLGMVSEEARADLLKHFGVEE